MSGFGVFLPLSHLGTKAGMAHAAVRLKASGMANYRQGGRTKEMIEVWKLIKSLR
jgi:hypothetical protein